MKLIKTYSGIFGYLSGYFKYKHWEFNFKTQKNLSYGQKYDTVDVTGANGASASANDVTDANGASANASASARAVDVTDTYISLEKSAQGRKSKSKRKKRKSRRKTQKKKLRKIR